MGDFPSGQRGQTVNLLAMPSVVRIHHPPPKKQFHRQVELLFLLWGSWSRSLCPFRGKSTIPHQKKQFHRQVELFFCCGDRGVEVYPPLGVNPPSPTIPPQAMYCSKRLSSTLSPCTKPPNSAASFLPPLLRRPFFLSVRSEQPLAPIAASWHNCLIFRICYGKRTRFLIAWLL